MAGAVVAHEQEVLPAQGDHPQQSLAHVVVQRQVWILKEPYQRIPVVQRIADLSAHAALRSEAIFLLFKPTMKVVDDFLAPSLPQGQVLRKCTEWKEGRESRVWQAPAAIVDLRDRARARKCLIRGEG